MSSTRREFLKTGVLLGSLGTTSVNAEVKQKARVDAICSPTGTKKFKLDTSVKRVRKSFYDLTDEELKTLCKAIGYMRNDMPTDSSLHWENYGRQHAHHCTESGEGNPQVHWSWYFLPWHRGYIYFLERILANILTTKLSIDGTKFAYPYWDWMTHKEIPNTRLRAQAGLASPLFGYDLTQEDMVNADNLGFDNTALYDGNRGPTILKSTMDPNNELTVDSQNHVKETLYYTSPEYIGQILATPFEQFGGKSTIDRNTGQGLLEQGPHNDGHDWVGTRIGKNRTMGTLRYAALDPIFYMHHGNIDRIFSMYKNQMPDLNGPWGKQTYQYTDIDGSWVTVSVKDIMTGITDSISYGESNSTGLLKSTAPKKITRTVRTTVNKEITNKPVEVNVSLLDNVADILKSQIALLDVTMGAITYTGKYQIDIYIKDANGEQVNVGRIRMLDGEHRKDTSPNATHKFSVLLKQIKSPPIGNIELTFVPPKNGVKMLIKNVEWMSLG